MYYYEIITNNNIAYLRAKNLQDAKEQMFGKTIVSIRRVSLSIVKQALEQCLYKNF